MGDLNGEVKSESVSLLKVLLFTISTKFRTHPVYVSLVWLLAGLPGQPACKLAGLLPAQTKNSVEMTREFERLELGRDLWVVSGAAAHWA